MSRFAAWSAVAVLSFLGSACGPTPAARVQERSRFEFALIGDLQYRPETDPDFDRLLATIDREPLAFVVHVGDFKDSHTPCTDSLFQLRRTQFDRSAHPFVFLFGDNDWYDCFLAGDRPAERLRALRGVFATGDSSLGRTRMRLERASAQPENVRWERGGVLFVGLDVPGNQKTWPEDPEEAVALREVFDANVGWLREGFRIARERGLRGVVVLFQANPIFHRAGLPPETLRRLAAYDPLVNALRDETLAFGRPVALVHGDLHSFLVDMPLRDTLSMRVVPNLTRVQVFGDPDAHWVRGVIDGGDPQVFRFTPELLPPPAAP